MSAGHPHLSRLLDLAKEPSSERRRDLLREVTDLFLDAPQQYSESESDHFGAIMGRVAIDMELAVRKQLAERLASVPEAPRSLITQLASDEIDVANPVLSQSLVLKDADLIALAKIKGQDHLMAISKRPQVSEAVADAVVARADDTVLETLVSNVGAKFSRSAMETVVKRAETNERLQAPVAARKDLPPDLMNEMFFFVSTSLKRYIMERMKDVDERMIDQALRATKRSIAQSSGGPAFVSAEQFIDQKIRNRELNEHLLVKLLREKRMPEFIAGFARITGLDIPTSKRILSDRSAEAAAIACKASQFDRSTFAAIVLLIDQGRPRSAQETNELLSMYDQVPADIAQRTMRFWKVRKQTSDAPAQPQAAAG